MDITSAIIAFFMLPSLFMILVGVGIADTLEGRREQRAAATRDQGE